VFNTLYVSNMRRLEVTPSFLIFDCDRMSISTAGGRLKLEMRSLIDRATTVFYSWFVDSHYLSSTVSAL
jgi:hypothetical protein